MQVVEVRTVEVEVEHYAGSPPTLTDQGEPAETYCTEAHDIETEEVISLSEEEERTAISIAMKEETEAFNLRFQTGPKPF
tara:strand:- start:767 stop:1006 length:240 start_codon:yes stop_codon:yes gene_type:complete